MKIKKDNLIKIDGEEYEVLNLIKEGGNGRIFKVKDKNGKLFALKEIKLEGISKEKKKRYERNLKEVKNFKHENIIEIKSIKIKEVDEKKQIIYIMPLYEKDFEEVIKEENNLSFITKFRYILKICNAIKFIHDKNIIHRDIKPENILINKDKLVLIDFEIAHFEIKEEDNLTKNVEILANRNYSSPEQKNKKNANNITKASDIYSLGIIINELFTGKRLEGANFKLIVNKYPFLYKIDEIVEKCINFYPENRPAIDEIIYKMNKILKELKEEKGQIKIHLLKNIEKDFKKYNDEYHNDEEYIKLLNNNKIKNKILEKASLDILSMKYLLNKKSYSYIVKNLNINYSCDIIYKASDDLKRIFLDYEIFKECLKKFKYEANGYKNHQYIPLNLNKNEDIKIFSEFKNKLEELGISNSRTLKLFVSCCDYHCNEILETIPRYEKEIEIYENTTIIDIIKKVKEIQETNGCEYLLEDDKKINGLLINYFKTYYHFEKSYKEISKDFLVTDIDKERVKMYLEKIKKKWNIIYFEDEEDTYTLIFKNKIKYKELKNKALTKAKSIDNEDRYLDIKEIFDNKKISKGEVILEYLDLCDLSILYEIIEIL